MRAEDFKKHLCENIIPFWNKLRDDEFGGFYGEMDYNLKVNKKADKGVILNSRILWFYSNAYMMLKDKSLRDNARQAFEFLRDACLDEENGGVYWSCTYDGKPSDTQKHTYNQAFAIYALSSYYDVMRDEEALDIAFDLFDLIENRLSDEGGYLEAFDRTFNPIVNEQLSENGVIAGRTMNTLLHVIEAYTELFRVSGDEFVGEALVVALDIFANRIYNNERQICDVFFDEDYKTIIDLESYGHDIEASWLIDRAVEVLDAQLGGGVAEDEDTAVDLDRNPDSMLDDELREKICAMTEDLCDTAYNNAFDKASGGFNNECEAGKVDNQKIWWVQAEAIIGFVNGYSKDNSKTFLLDGADSVWNYTQENVVDKRCGEWFESVKADGSLDETQGIVHEWKCPYHNGRMCLEMMKRL